MAIVAGGCRKKPEPIVITPDIEKSHLQRNHIFGTVRNIQTFTYYLGEDSIPVSDTTNIAKVIAKRKADFSTWQRYSADGFLMHYTKFNQNKDTLMHQEYAYNWKAKLVHWEESDSTGAIVTRGKYIYDRNDFLCGEQVFQGDSVVMAFTYTTDGIGNIVKSTQSFGDYSTHTENKYNALGLVEKITEYEPNGKPFKTVKIEYDNYGDEVNRCVYKAGDQMVEYTYNQYNQEGRQIKTIYEDKLHHQKEVTYYADYDSQNNWQTEIKVKDNKIISIRKRKIIYY
ncbi:MAG: hypothetical protein MJZ87_05525 [Bacteroidales bacterium]|nr:hypothetical protein [Bacteroidales bacterium]